MIGQPARSAVRAGTSTGPGSAPAAGPGETSVRRAPRPAGPFGGQVAGVPGRRALLLEGLGAVVERRRRRRGRDRGRATAERPPRTTQAPRRARSQARARSRGRPSVSHGTTVAPVGPQCGGQRPRPPVGRRPRSSSPTAPASPATSSPRSAAGGQRTTATGRLGGVGRQFVRRRATVAGLGRSRCGTPSRPRSGRTRRDDGRRGGGPEQRQAGAGEAPGGPGGQVDDLRRGAGGDGGQEGAELLRGRLGDDVVVDHPAPDPAAAEVDPHDGADADDAGQGVGHRVVEEPLDGQHVDGDPADAGRRHERRRPERRPADQPPAAARRVSAMSSTCSQVNSLSGRPKCP